MTATQFALAAAAATAGGLTGAIGTALLSWSAVGQAAHDLGEAFDKFRRGEGDISELEHSLERVMASLGHLAAALGRLKEMLRIR